MYLVYSIILHIVLLFFLTYKDKTSYNIEKVIKENDKLKEINKNQENKIKENEYIISALSEFNKDKEKISALIKKQNELLNEKEKKIENLNQNLNEKDIKLEEIDMQYNQYKYYSNNLILNTELKKSLMQLEEYILDNLDSNYNLIFEIIFDDSGNISIINDFNTFNNQDYSPLYNFSTNSLFANKKIQIKLYNREFN